MTATDDAYTIVNLIVLLTLPFTLSLATELITALLTYPTSLVMIPDLVIKTIPLFLISCLSWSILALGIWIDSLDFL